jgi:phospholipase C
VPGFSQKDAKGNTVTPFLLTDPVTPDLNHDRSDYVATWNNGAMDGFARNNGTLSLGHYDNTTPGVDLLWGWAQQFALADNFFASVMADAPTNQLMLVAADDNGSPFSIEPFFGPCNTTGATAHAGYTFQNVGDQLTAKGISWAWFNENLHDCGHYISQQNPFQFFTSTHAAPNIRDLDELTAALPSGNVPAVSFVQAGPANSSHPGSGSLTVAMNWLDGFIKSVQASPVWNQSAIIVLWDASGGWWDHVPPPQVDAVNQGFGPRVPMLVISPFAKKGYVSHVQMDDVSILKFIQQVNKLDPLNARTQSSNDITDMFTF